MARKPGCRLGKKRVRVEKKARFLVVTEGAVTEPSYFERLRPFVEAEYAATFTIKPKISEASKGRGKNWNPNPNAVVEHCIELLQKGRKKHRADRKAKLKVREIGCYPATAMPRFLT